MLSMKNEIEKIWDDVLVKLEQEHDVSSAAINAWIKPLHIKDKLNTPLIVFCIQRHSVSGCKIR